MITENLPPPAGVLLLYPVMFLGEVASISRLLFINDPVFSFAVAILCLYYYLQSADARERALVRTECSLLLLRF